jgi:hypothetical protein
MSATRRRRTLSDTLRKRSTALLALGLGVSGCYAEELADLRGQVERLQSCQACAQSQLTQGLALALCSPPVRQLIDDVSQVCRREDVCLDQKISTLVGDADPTHQGKFITLMRQQPHSAVYFSTKDSLVGGGEGLYAQRLKRLVSPQPPWLPTTRFLIVSNLKAATGSEGGKLSTGDPSVKRAESRGQQIIERILDFGFAGPSAAGPSKDAALQKVSRQQLLHWVYSFSRKKDEILSPDDQPVPGTDLSQSVWVFRVDCATPDSSNGNGLENSACQQCQAPPAATPGVTPATTASGPAS